MNCNCFVARHPQVSEIDAALKNNGDPRALAAQFGIGKSRLYDHRKHLGLAPREPASRPVAVAVNHPKNPARAVESVPKAAVVDKSSVRMERPVETVEPTVEQRGTGEKVAVLETVPTARALPESSGVKSAYAMAVEAAMFSIVRGEWRPASIEKLVQNYGLARSSARGAHAEAVRHLQLNMGDAEARQVVSASLAAAQRDEAIQESRKAKTSAALWRRQEAEAQTFADTQTGKERMIALDRAAHMGLLATKYDLSAEKWSALALKAQQHHDDVLCLLGPKSATQININANAIDFERFARALCRRFAHRPDVLAEIDQAVTEIEHGGVVVVESEAA